MFVLGIDSSGHNCSVCLLKGGSAVRQIEEKMSRGQDSRLMPMIMEIMKEGGADFSDLRCVAATRGPGSFTGIRIGLSAAKGIGLAASKPVLGVDRFRIYRARCAGAKNLLVVLDSKRREYFCRRYENGTVGKPEMLAAHEILFFARNARGLTVSGDCNEILKPLLPEGISFEDGDEGEAVTCARIASMAETEDGEFAPKPLYIRAPDVTLKE